MCWKSMSGEMFIFCTTLSFTPLIATAISRMLSHFKLTFVYFTHNLAISLLNWLSFSSPFSVVDVIVHLQYFMVGWKPHKQSRFLRESTVDSLTVIGRNPAVCLGCTLVCRSISPSHTSTVSRNCSVSAIWKKSAYCELIQLRLDCFIINIKIVVKHYILY